MQAPSLYQASQPESTPQCPSLELQSTLRVIAGYDVEVTYITAQCVVVRVLPYGTPQTCSSARATALYLLGLEERLRYEAEQIAAWEAFKADQEGA